MSDQLSEVFDLVEVEGLVSGGFEARGPWRWRTATAGALTLVAVVSGGALLATDGVEGRVELSSGDVALLNGRSWLELTGGSGEGRPREIPAPLTGPYIPFSGPDGDRVGVDVVVAGAIELNLTGQELLQQVLPPVGHVREAVSTATHLRCSLDRVFEEARAGRMGSAFAMRQYGQLLLLDSLRAYVDQTDLPPGWLRVLTDERLRPALRLMHARPGERWTVQDLAHAAAMSRTSFAARFRATAGIAPLAYLNRWRLLLAKRALRDGDTRVGPLAFDLGYASESAFSTAFKRQVGQSPARYRSRAHERSSTTAGASA